MVHASKHHNKAADIWEAKIFLIIRAAQRAFYRTAQHNNNSSYAKALMKEFELKNVKFQGIRAVAATSGKEVTEDFLCFDDLAVFIRLDRKINLTDEVKLRNYLKHCKASTGLLITLDKEGLNIRRIMQA